MYVSCEVLKYIFLTSRTVYSIRGTVDAMHINGVYFVWNMWYKKNKAGEITLIFLKVATIRLRECLWFKNVFDGMSADWKTDCTLIVRFCFSFNIYIKEANIQV